MFDHFPNMFGLGQLKRDRPEATSLKNQLFRKKKFLIFQQTNFFFPKIFLKKFLVPKPTRKWHT
jgi:hypothetical protein